MLLSAHVWRFIFREKAAEHATVSAASLPTAAEHAASTPAEQATPAPPAADGQDAPYEEAAGQATSDLP